MSPSRSIILCSSSIFVALILFLISGKNSIGLPSHAAFIISCSFSLSVVLVLISICGLLFALAVPIFIEPVICSISLSTINPF